MSNTVQKMLSGTLYVILAVVLVGAVILILPVYWNYVTMQDENTRMEQEYRALREEITIRDDQVFALPNVAHAGPACDRGTAGKNTHGAEEERQGIAAHRRKGHGGAEGYGEYVKEI